MRKLNLNNYELCEESEATLRLTLQALPDGTVPSPLFYRTKRVKPVGVTVSDIEAGGVEWYPSIPISTEGTPDDYNAVVMWWFNEAAKNEAYADSINDRYLELEDVMGNVLEIKSWLLDTAAYRINGDGEYIDRKTDLNRFLRNCMNRNLKQHKNRKARMGR